MREPYERIAGGPFRDDTHRAAVEATAVDLAGRQLSGVSGHMPGSPGRAADGVSGGLATQTHAGASEAAQRAPQGREAAFAKLNAQAITRPTNPSIISDLHELLNEMDQQRIKGIAAAEILAALGYEWSQGHWWEPAATTMQGGSDG
jgi:hypothetical protein